MAGPGSVKSPSPFGPSNGQTYGKETPCRRGSTGREDLFFRQEYCCQSTGRRVVSSSARPHHLLGGDFTAIAYRPSTSNSGSNSETARENSRTRPHPSRPGSAPAAQPDAATPPPGGDAPRRDSGTGNRDETGLNGSPNFLRGWSGHVAARRHPRTPRPRADVRERSGATSRQPRSEPVPAWEPLPSPAGTVSRARAASPVPL
jgi:hypothetical protein